MAPNERPVSRVRTFLFTDLERSSMLWERQPEEMTSALREHFELITAAVDGNDGEVFNHTGDGLVAVFDSPQNAVVAAAEAQRALGAAAPTPMGRLRSRMGIHTGICYESSERYSGKALNYCARLHAVGHAEQVLVSGATAALVDEHLPDGLGLLLLGEYWLRDVREPVLIHQVTGPGLTRVFPTIRSRATSIDRLPPEISDIIGRERELAHIREIVLVEKERLVTLTGEAGVGKSRLARRIAGDVWTEFRDGVHWIDVATLGGESFAAAVAGHLRIPFDREESDIWSQIAKAISNDDVLLIVDGCETELEAVRAFVERVLVESSSVTVLTTSHAPIGLTSEIHKVIDPLPVGDITDLHAAAAVELFRERAHAAQPHLAFGTSARDAMHRIATALDGLPFAIEQAAASLDVFTLEELAEAVSTERLDRVPGFDRLRGSLQRSASLLSTDESALLDQLPVFRGDLTARSVAAVCFGGDRSEAEVQQLLAGLTRRSLIHTTRLQGETHYRMLETVRTFATDETPLPDDLVDRHHRFHVELALQEGNAYRRGDQHRPAAALAGGWDDIGVAVRRSIAVGDHDEAADVLVAIHEFCIFSLRTEIHDWAAELRPTLTDVDRLAAITSMTAMGAWLRGDMERALDLADEAIALEASPASTHTAHRTAMNALGYLGRIEEAFPHFFALVAACDASGEGFWKLDGLATTSIGLSINGDPGAEAKAREAVDLARTLGNQDGYYWSFYALGTALTPTNPLSAQAAFERAVSEAESVGSQFNVNNGRFELLLLRRRYGVFAIESAQIAWELLSQFARSRSYAQVWQLVIETSWMLASCDYYTAAADLWNAVQGKPRMPRPDIQALDDGLRSQIDAGLPAGETLERRPETFPSDGQIVESCYEGLARILGS